VAQDEEDPDKVLARVGRRIGELREKAGVTQRHVAEVLETNVSNYQRIENGEQNLTLKTMVVIARAIGVKTVDLLKPPVEAIAKPRPRGRPKKTVR